MVEGRQAVKAKRKKKGLAKLIFFLIFCLGLGALAFPLVSQYLHYRASLVEVKVFDQAVKKLTDKEIEERIRLAQAYNDALYHGTNQVAGDLSDPFSKAEQEAGIKEYARMLEVNEQIGYVSIPKISQELPVFAGTNEEVLQKGVGHLEGTSLPVGGNNSHAVITAHRGLPNARLFTDLNELAIGDYFYFHNLSETLAYQVDDLKTIKPEEVEHLEVVPGHDYLTLLTCTPYMINSHRLLVRGHQVPYDPAVEEKQLTEHRDNNRYRILFYLTLACLVTVLIFVFFGWLKRHKKRRVSE